VGVEEGRKSKMGTMGKIGKYIIIAVLLALSFSLVTAVPTSASPGTIQVDVNDPSCVTGSGQPDPYSVVYCSIQDAIDDANPAGGDTIIVAAGTYNEQVVINKSLTLISDTGDYRTTGVILNGPIALNNVENVTVQGFKFQDCSSSGYKHVIYTGGTADNIAIAANSFDNCEGLNIHIYYGGDTWFENWTITNNKITKVTGTNASGIWVQRLRNSTISNNEISNTTYAGMILDRIENVTVSNNNISNTPQKGIQVATSQDCNVVIENNYITNTNTSHDADEGAVTIYPDVTNIRIENNTLTANYQGFTVRDKAGTVSDVYVNCNNIYGNDGFGIGNFAQGDGTIDATNNWWGCKSGPGNPGCDTVVGDVDYTPWLTGRWQVSPPCGTPPPPPPPPSAEHGAAVGIEVYSVDKPALLAPWIALAFVIIAGGIILVRRRRAHS